MLGVSATNDDGTVGLYSSMVLKTNITANGVSYFNGGNVGIGTTAPAAKLHISGSSNDQLPQLIVHGVGAPATFNWASTFINSALSSSRNYISLIGQALSTRNSGYIGFNHSGTDGSTSNFLTFGLYGVDNILNINGNGRVGIGTTNPTQKLDIVGSYGVAGDDSGILKIRGGVTDATQLNFGVSADGGYGWIQTTDVGLSNDKNIILNPIGGNVGIGTTSPAFTYGGGLEIERATTSTLRIQYTGGFATEIFANSTGTNIYQLSAADMTFGTNNTERMRIQADGNVGIGTTSPICKLQVGSATFNGGNGVYTNDRIGVMLNGSLTSYVYASTYNDPTYPDYGFVFIHGTNTSNYNVWSISPDGPAKGSGLHFIYGANATNIHSTTPKISFIGSSGNVGIGTTGPISRLNVYASGSNLSVLKVDGGNGTLFEVTDNLSGSLFSVNTIAGLPVLEVFSDNKIVAGQYGTNDFVISGSKIGIGTSVPNTAKLHIYDSTNSFTRYTNTTNAGHFVDVGANQAGQSFLFSYGAYPVLIGTNGGERMRIDSNGNVGIGTTSPSGKLHVVGNADIGDSTADTGIIVRHGAGSAQYGRIRFYDSNGLNVNTIHSFPVAWQGGTLLNSSAGAVNITGWNGVTFGSWNNVDVAFASNGTNYFKGNVGIGTTTPSASLHINSTTAGATLLRTDGTNGTLFSVVDDLSDSLMSVNNSAGLPVFEVFADDRIVSGQYGQNDLIVINNKVGIGTNNPLGKLHVTGSSSTPAAIFLGSVGIGTTSPTNALTVSGSANITGALTKGSGTFLINHPDPAKPGWKLQHSFVESPTVGDNIYRYIIDIDNTLSGSIELPSYWKFLNENPQIWINPVKHFGIAYGELNEELSVMNVYANSAGKYNILLIGTRKDPTIKRLMPEFNVEFESK